MRIPRDVQKGKRSKEGKGEINPTMCCTPKRGPHIYCKERNFRIWKFFLKSKWHPSIEKKKEKKKEVPKKESKLSLEVQEGGPTLHIARPIWGYSYIQRFRFSPLKINLRSYKVGPELESLAHQEKRLLFSSN